VVAVGVKQQILCDMDSASAASVMDFTGSGFSFQGQGFANYGSSQPLQLSGVPGQGSQAALSPSEYAAHLQMWRQLLDWVAWVLAMDGCVQCSAAGALQPPHSMHSQHALANIHWPTCSLKCSVYSPYPA
jgi:hypothetical protein